MEGLAFEFVTITNPGEIKDPKKQSAIRRKARRRPNNSKFIQKPFELVIDFPVTGDINSGTELRIAGHEVLPSAEYEISELNTEIHSLHSLSPASTGSELVATSILPPGLNSQIFRIDSKEPLSNIPKVQKRDNGRLCRLMQALWSSGQMVLTEFFVKFANTLANASIYIRPKYPFNYAERQESIQLYSKALQSLRNMLQQRNNSKGLEENDIMPVLLFAYYDILLLNTSRWLIHMSGLTDMIRGRNGFSTVSTSESILKLNSWIDISGSFLFDNIPFSPSLTSLPAQVTQQGSLSPFLRRWNAAFPEHSDITAFWVQAVNLSKTIDSRDEIWTDTQFVQTSFNAVVHKLLSLPRYVEVIENGMPSPQLVMREAMRRAYLILFALLREKFSVHPSGISQHRNRVKELLVRRPVGWSEFLELRLWVLFTASLAAEDDETSWYIIEIRTTMVEMGLYEWGEGIAVVRGMLWMGEKFRTRNENLEVCWRNQRSIRI